MLAEPFTVGVHSVMRANVQLGDTVIVQTKHWEHEPGQAYIKIYRRRGGGKLILEQINPRAIVEIPLEFVTAIHRVATDNDLFLF